MDTIHQLLDEEDAVDIADIVTDQHLLFVGIEAKASTQLLQIDSFGVSAAQEDYMLSIRNVHAFVELVDNQQMLEISQTEVSQYLAVMFLALPGVVAGGIREELEHILCVLNTLTENNGLHVLLYNTRSYFLVKGLYKDSVVELLEGNAFPFGNFCHHLPQCFGIQVVGNQMILHRRQPAIGDGFFQRDIHDLLTKEFADILLFVTIGSRRHAQQVAGREILNGAFEGRGLAMMAFVHDDKVKLVFVEDVLPFRHGLESSEENGILLTVFLISVEIAHTDLLAQHFLEGSAQLPQDLGIMCEDQSPQLGTNPVFGQKSGND